MIRELLNALVTEYDRINGTGTLLVLFVVAILLIVLMPRKERPALFENGTGLIAAILSIWGMAAYALTTLLRRVFGSSFAAEKSRTSQDSSAEKSYASKDPSEDNGSSASCRVITVITAVMAVLLCVFGIMLSGNMPQSAGTVSMTENMYHIDVDLMKAFDYMLAEADDTTRQYDFTGQEEGNGTDITKGSEPVTIIAEPGTGNILKAYSSRFETLFDEPSRDEDILYYDEDIRNLYAEVTDQNPDMYKVSKIARAHNCMFYLTEKGEHWPEFPITFFDADLSAEFGNWEVYRFIYEEGGR